MNWAFQVNVARLTLCIFLLLIPFYEIYMRYHLVTLMAFISAGSRLLETILRISMTLSNFTLIRVLLCKMVHSNIIQGQNGGR